MTTKKTRLVADPLMVQVVENNVLLKRAIDDLKEIKEKDLKEIKEKQDLNHLVAIALRDHQTIERVDEIWTDLHGHEVIKHTDSMWADIGNLKFLIRVIAGTLALFPITAAGLTVTHFVYHWPA